MKYNLRKLRNLKELTIGTYNLLNIVTQAHTPRLYIFLTIYIKKLIVHKYYGIKPLHI